MNRILKGGIFISMLLLWHGAVAQCKNDELVATCEGKIASGFNFLKSYSLEKNKGLEGRLEYPYIFSKDTQYSIEVCGPEGQIEIAILDSKRKELFNSTDRKTGKSASKAIFKCASTDVYYIVFHMKGEGEAGCGAGVLSFKR